MTRRKGEVSRVDIMCKWPHHVSFAADMVRGLANTDTVCGFAKTLTNAPRPYHVCRDDNDFVVFCFDKPEDAETFCLRFGGERRR